MESHGEDHSREVGVPQKCFVMCLTSVWVLSFKSFPGAPSERAPGRRDALACPCRDCQRGDISSFVVAKVARRGLSPKWSRTPFLFSHSTLPFSIKGFLLAVPVGNAPTKLSFVFCSMQQYFTVSVALVVQAGAPPINKGSILPLEMPTKLRP